MIKKFTLEIDSKDLNRLQVLLSRGNSYLIDSTQCYCFIENSIIDMISRIKLTDEEKKILDKLNGIDDDLAWIKGMNDIDEKVKQTKNEKTNNTEEEMPF